MHSLPPPLVSFLIPRTVQLNGPAYTARHALLSFSSSGLYLFFRIRRTTRLRYCKGAQPSSPSSWSFTIFSRFGAHDRAPPPYEAFMFLLVWSFYSASTACCRFCRHCCFIFLLLWFFSGSGTCTALRARPSTSSYLFLTSFYGSGAGTALRTLPSACDWPPSS